MLTADLVRVTRRQGELKPTWIRPRDPALVALAEELLGLYRSMEGAARSELEEAVSLLVPPGRAGLIGRGLTKLIDDRATWDTEAPAPPARVREKVFSLAAERHPVVPQPWAPGQTDRAQVLELAARALDISVPALEASLYADLREEQRLLGFREMEPQALLDRYNLALPQALVLRARQMRVATGPLDPGRLRQFFRHLKFFQLMHRAERLPDGGWSFCIDGPVSVIQQTQRYGLQLANLLGTLPLLSKWSMEAEVTWGRDRTPGMLRLDERSPLRSPWKASGTWQSAEEKLLLERLVEPVRGWRAERASDVLPLGPRDVLVPDLRLVHAPSGREVWVEIVGFWRSGWLEARREALVRHGPPNLVLCLSRRLAVEEKLAALEGLQVVDFAEVISIPKLLAAAEGCAG